MYIFKYVNKNTRELIGYHLSTFCQVGNKEDAKRYTCSNGYENQLEVISKNLKSTLNPNSTGMFSSITKSIRENDFKNLKFEEVEIYSEYLTDGITQDDIQYNIHTIINDGQVNKVNIPLENLGEVIKEIHNSKLN